MTLPTDDEVEADRWSALLDDLSKIVDCLDGLRDVAVMAITRDTTRTTPTDAKRFVNAIRDAQRTLERARAAECVEIAVAPDMVRDLLDCIGAGWARP